MNSHSLRSRRRITVDFEWALVRRIKAREINDTGQRR